MRAVNQWYLAGGFAVVASALGAGTVADAGTLSTTVPVTMNLVDSCSAFSASAIDLGTKTASNYDTATSTPFNASVTCSNGAAWQMTVQCSSDPTTSSYYCNGADVKGFLKAGDGTTVLLYQINKDASQNPSPLETTPGSGTYTPLTGAGTGAAQDVPLYLAISGAGGFKVGQASGSFTLILNF